MDGEIDLELYTISIIRLNSALEKLDSTDEATALFEESYNDLQKLYEDIVSDLNQDEININEYYLFFQNGKQTFPQIIDVLGSIDNSELQDIINKLLNVFSNLNKISDAFKEDYYNEL